MSKRHNGYISEWQKSYKIEWQKSILFDNEDVSLFSVVDDSRAEEFAQRLSAVVGFEGVDGLSVESGVEVFF
jgi:hypothetical protein